MVNQVELQVFSFFFFSLFFFFLFFILIPDKHILLQYFGCLESSKYQATDNEESFCKPPWFQMQ